MDTAFMYLKVKIDGYQIPNGSLIKGKPVNQYVRTVPILLFNYILFSGNPHPQYNRHTHRIHGTGIFTYIWLNLYGKLVGKYTIHYMDPMG